MDVQWIHLLNNSFGNWFYGISSFLFIYFLFLLDREVEITLADIKLSLLFPLIRKMVKYEK